MPKVNARPQGLLGDNYQPHEYVQLEDLIVGRMIQMLGNNFFICDADKFTRDYFDSKFGIVLREKVDVEIPRPEVPTSALPPYTGYGSEEDSMSSVLHLLPRPPKKDWRNIAQRERVLRFKAERRMLGNETEPSELSYVLVYYIQDDTISINATARQENRNSGEYTGKYLLKGKYVDQLTGKEIIPDLLIPPSRIQILGKVYVITEMDEFSEKWFASRKIAGRDPRGCVEERSLVNTVLVQLREVMKQQTNNGKDIFRRFDRNRDSVLTVEEFAAALKKFGFYLEPDEVLQLMRYYDKDNDGQISYNEFCDTIIDENYGRDLVKKNLSVKVSTEENMQEYARSARFQSLCRVEDVELRRAIRGLSEILHNRPKLSGKLRFELNKLVAKDGLLTPEILRSGLIRCGYTFDLIDIQRCLEFISPNQDIDFISFLVKFPATYHDFCRTR